MQVQPSHAYGDVQRPLSRARRSSLGAPRNLMTFSPLCSGEGSDSLAGSLVKRSVDPSSARLSCARLQILVNQSRKMPSVADRILAHGWSPNAQARPRMVVHCPFAPAGGSFDDSYDSTEDVGRCERPLVNCFALDRLVAWQYVGMHSRGQQRGRVVAV